MLDIATIEGFQWDSGNARKNEKHGMNHQEAEQVFMNQPLLVLEDVKLSGGEPRFHALGKTDEGRLLQVVFTVRGSGRLIRIISARSMHRRERTVYGQTSEADS